MASRTATAESNVTEIKPSNPFGLIESTLDLGARGQFKFRELTVEENDMCREAATDKKDQTFNGRTMMRMMIVTSAVDPKLQLTDLVKLPQRVFARIVDFVNDLNDANTLATDDETEPGN